MFNLDSKLQADSFFVKDLEFSRLLLMNDQNYPWFILVPRKKDLVELTDLSLVEQNKVLKEINQISNILKSKFSAEKINIATLGNVVKQLHIHVIGRFEDDASYPSPVWGAVKPKQYEIDKKNKIINEVRGLL